MTVSLAAALVVAAGCGKKGPPLPPLVRLPAAPAEMSAARRGNEVVLQFVVPSANTDGTRPANVSRIDVFGIEAGDPLSGGQPAELSTKIASVAVKSPRDPDRTIDPGESAEDIEPLEGDGLDQGARATVVDQLSAAVIGVASGEGAPPARTYLAVSIDTRGRTGPMSERVTVPLIPAPAAPAAPTVTYDETSSGVQWAPVEGASGYHVYQVPAAAAASAPERPAAAAETRLTSKPLSETAFTESRVAFGATRCYAVRAVTVEGELAVESVASPPACVTFADTFAPSPPKDLRGVASEGSISLIWEPNGEPDLAGYLVLRGVPGGVLEPIVLSPIKETVFTDNVPPGVRYVYAVSAVDHAGNGSAESNRFEDAGR